MFGVSPRTIRSWIDTGAWPLPHSVCRRVLYFRLADTRCWLKTGKWPAGVRFRDVSGFSEDDALASCRAKRERKPLPQLQLSSLSF